MNVSLDEHRLGGLRWIALNGPARDVSTTWHGGAHGKRRARWIS